MSVFQITKKPTKQRNSIRVGRKGQRVLLNSYFRPKHALSLTILNMMSALWEHGLSALWEHGLGAPPDWTGTVEYCTRGVHNVAVPGPNLQAVGSQISMELVTT